MANNVIDAAIRLRDLFTPTVRSVNASLGTMKTQMAAAKQSVSGLSDKLTEHEHIQQTGSKISGLSDKMALLNYEAIISQRPIAVHALENPTKFDAGLYAFRKMLREA